MYLADIKQKSQSNWNSACNTSKEENGNELKCYLQAPCPCPEAARHVASKAGQRCLSTWMQIKSACPRCPVLCRSTALPCVCYVHVCGVCVEVINLSDRGGDTGKIRLKEKESTYQRRQQHCLQQHLSYSVWHISRSQLLCVDVAADTLSSSVLCGIGFFKKSVHICSYSMFFFSLSSFRGRTHV